LFSMEHNEYRKMILKKLVDADMNWGAAEYLSKRIRVGVSSVRMALNGYRTSQTYVDILKKIEKFLDKKEGKI